ncbi:hypothetical protein DRN63_03245 [Nanoarchaeota archaeon]|nr:MAG: hypothetical protein DRN63_03245 [Nanoarchaeota archaeon]
MIELQPEQYKSLIEYVREKEWEIDSLVFDWCVTKCKIVNWLVEREKELKRKWIKEVRREM